ncbi:hypothetical protein EDC61_102270 [Sulfuritortus calidifontis]|uniref:Tetratricopeptide repeat protein n=1 Tax=Sulfuritortus calidifontis TaxID=1914471 RepID=A0A4R3JY64_9PROT|nr:hypothetical protein [Sulfuritortus calidifontis]TCS73492.1 hypothetical protein EDC61_102270 [Sulfuritortus calidifontis]
MMPYEAPWNAVLLRLSRELPDLPWAAGIGQPVSFALLVIAALILIWLLLRLRRHRRRSTTQADRIEIYIPDSALSNGPHALAPAAASEPEPGIPWDGTPGYGSRQYNARHAAETYDFDDEAAGSDAITVSEADPLAEASIFIMYGYHDRAAELLRWYLDDAGEAQAQVLQMLGDAYLKLERVDDFADILERLLLLSGPGETQRQALLEGLKIDPENLQLRVLAINYFGLDVDQINALLGLEPVAPVPIDAPARPPVPAAADSEPGAPAASPGEQTSGNLRLIEGRGPIAPLSQTEKLVVRSFLPPAQAARLHLAMHNHDEAIAALHRALRKQPNALVHFTELLKIHHGRRNVDEYARTLWHLYAALGNAGQSLKERLLAQGFSLGPHPLFEALAQARERGQIEAIGRQFGFHAADVMPMPKNPLVEISGTSRPTLDQAGGDVLQEVDSYLEFGQIDQAVEALESAILADPAAIHLYPPLLELYERMDDLRRLTELASGIKRRAQRPPEEVVAMMTGLFQRMKSRRERLAA